MAKPVIVKGKLVSGQLIIRSLKRGDSFSMMFEHYENGKRVQKMEKTGLLVEGNAREAKKMLVARVQEFDHQLEQQRQTLPKSNMRVSDWVRQWLKDREKRLDARTYEGYETHANNHILPYFDEHGTTLSELNGDFLQDYIDEKEANGRKDGKGGLSPKTLRHIKNVLNLALAAAIKAHLISKNPCEGLELPPLEHYDYKFYNEQKLLQMFEALKEEPLYPLIRMTSTYGLRRSEVLGLQWNSVDFMTNMFTIKRVVVKTKKTKSASKNKTKTKPSHRSFPLTPEIREALLALQAQEAENRRLFGKDYLESPRIFKWDDGRPYAGDFVTEKFAKLLKRHGLEHIRFHDLRHSCASLLLMWGYNLKDISEWMGHSNIRITMDLYGHLDVERKHQIADKMSERFSQV